MNGRNVCLTLMLGAVSFEAKGSDTGPREKARKFNVV